MRRLTGGLVVLVLLAAAASYQFELGPRWFGFDYPSPVDEPAAVPPPKGLTLAPAEDPVPVAAATEPADAEPRAVRRAVAGLLRDPRLGPDVAVGVGQLSDGEVVYRSGETRVIPASTLKLLTTAAALGALGEDHRFRTTVVAGTAPRRIVLVGGGDPLLARRPVPAGATYPPRADVQTLARATAKALRDVGRSRVRLGYDDTLFSGPSVSPDWKPSYLTDNVVSPVSPLWVDEGVDPDTDIRSADPARAAAEVFADALERRNIAVVGAPRPEAAPSEPTELAAVQSAPLGQVVQHVLDVSDNEAAEVLFRHVALATGRPGSFAAGSEAVKETLAELGVDASRDRILDGSGLARGNRLRPETLLDLITVASGPDHAALRPILTGLPVAGFSGSLAFRFQTGDDEGLGSVRAKTGTLSGVHGLAGTVTTDDGVVLGFVTAVDRVRVDNTLFARARLDEIAAALAACTCASP
jgi:D-alanyl-D-alanine carboxypeptidase/D-alanyl-D-alanine-endopeptidase (penicillin-binding protein 4)